MNLLSGPVFEAFTVPLIILVFGAYAKRLASDRKEFKRYDWYMGIEFVFIALASTLFKIFKHFRDLGVNMPVEDFEKTVDVLINLGGFTLFIIVALFISISRQRNWIAENNNEKKQIIYLGIFDNGMGLALISIYVLIFNMEM